MVSEIKSIRQIEKIRGDSLMASVEAFRREASLQLEARRRALMGQFFTPASVAMFMARMV